MYVGSRTRFEAVIIQDDDPSIGECLLGLGIMHVVQQKELPKVFSAEVGTASDGSTRWPIQHNVHVSSVFERHEVIWTDEDSFDEVAEANAAKHGSGTGRGFVSTLAEGDRVAVVVRTRVSVLIVLRVFRKSNRALSFLLERTMCRASARMYFIRSK